MSSRKSTRIQLKNDSVNDTKFTFFDYDSCREKTKNNCASTSLISEKELSELSQRKSHGEECNVPEIVSMKVEEICVKNEEVLEQRDFLTLKLKEDTESQPGNASNGTQSKRKSSFSEEEIFRMKIKQRQYRQKLKETLSEDELLKLRNKNLQQQREYRKKKKLAMSEEELLKLSQKDAQRCREYRKRKKLELNSLPEDEFLKVMYKKSEERRKQRERKKSARIPPSEEELLQRRKKSLQQKIEYRKRKESAMSEDELLQLRKKQAQENRERRKRKEIELSSLPKDELLKLKNKQREQRKKKYRERKENMLKSLSEEEFLKLRKEMSQRIMEYRKKKESAMSEDELLKLRKQRSEQQKKYRKIKQITLSSVSGDQLLKICHENTEQKRQYRARLHKEGKFSEMRARHTERQRSKRVSQDKEINLSSFSLDKDQELQPKNASTTNEGEDKELEMCSWDTESKLVPQQPIEQVFPPLTLEKVLELRWEKVKQTYFTKSEKENDIEM